MKTEQLAKAVLEKLKAAGTTVSTAESCTGGGIGHILTAVPGSSAVYAGGVISYTDSVKEKLLSVPGETLREQGAVSEQTARAMARGVSQLLKTDYGISATGLAGPEGDGSGKPVGLVYIGAAAEGTETVREFVFSGSREEVRQQAVDAALELLLEMIT